MRFLLKNKSIIKLYASSVLFLFILSPLNATTFTSDGMSLDVEKVAQNFTIPWGMAFLSESSLLVTERTGSIILLDLNKKKKTKLLNTPQIMTEGQGGLLDVALPPNFKSSGWIYFTYIKENNNKGVTVLSRAKLNQNKFHSWQELLVSKSGTKTSRHFGSRIAFDNNGHVFFSVGDRGIRKNAQDLKNHAGSIIRLNLDGSIPKDNPYIKGALSEIWSYGHRNPQGLTYDFKNNRLWEIEHGPRGGDELNLIQAGKNYGWPEISYGKEYWGPVSVGKGTHQKGMEQPVKYYVPSIAPGSLIHYTGNKFPQWKGNLFAGALKLRHINRIILNEAGHPIREERLLESLGLRIRALAQSPQGILYFSTDSGSIYQIKN